MQNYHLLKNFSSNSIIEKIEFTIQKIRSRNGPVVSIDTNQVDRVIKRQHGNHQTSSNLCDDYISDLQNLSWVYLYLIIMLINPYTLQ